MKHLKLDDCIEKMIGQNNNNYRHVDLLTAYQKLQKTYSELKNTSDKTSSLLLQSDAEYIAYLLARMPATYAVAAKILNDFFAYSFPQKIETLLDLGTGTGAVLWTAMDKGLKKITALDQDPKMIALSKKLIAENHPAFFEIINWKQANLTEYVEEKRHDVVTLSYVLIEQNQNEKEKILEYAWNLATHALILIEPGTKAGYLNCLNARDFFIKKGGYIAAPCSHQEKCPIKGDDWCHFSERIDRSFWQKSFKKATLGYEDEPYSYLIVTKNAAGKQGERILKTPLKRSGHIIFELCAPNDIKKVTVSKKNSETFKIAKKKKWGDVL